MRVCQAAHRARLRRLTTGQVCKRNKLQHLTNTRLETVKTKNQSKAEIKLKKAGALGPLLQSKFNIPRLASMSLTLAVKITCTIKLNSGLSYPAAGAFM